MNKMEINKGEIISDIVLIDGYSLLLRYNLVRERINSKLEELAFDGVCAQVCIDECDRLVVAFYVDDNKTDDTILIKKELDAQDNKAKFIESINKMFNNLIKKKMKKTKMVVAPIATQEERNSCALDVAKILNLCKGENAAIMQKVEFDISKACRKLTNGAIDTVSVEEGLILFNNNLGLQTAFNSVGRSEKETALVITTFINAMMELSEALKSLDETSEDSKFLHDKPANEQPVKSENVVPEQSGKLKPGQKKEYNKLITPVLDTIDFNSEIGKRAFSQQLRGKMLHCAHDVGLKVARGTSIEALVSLMTPGNVERVKTLYDLYNQPTPSWLTKPSGKNITKKRTMTA